MELKAELNSDSRPVDRPEFSIMVSFALGNDTDDTKS